MTRKDYVSIAKAFKAERIRIVLLPTYGRILPRSTVAQRTAQLLTLENLITFLVAELQDDNPKFDEKLFRISCGLTEVQP